MIHVNYEIIYRHTDVTVGFSWHGAFAVGEKCQISQRSQAIINSLTPLTYST